MRKWAMEIFEGLEHIVRANEPLAPHTTPVTA